MKLRVRILPLSHDQDEADRRFWRSRPPKERIAAVEILRARMGLIRKHGRHSRLRRVFRIIEHA